MSNVIFVLSHHEAGVLGVYSTFELAAQERAHMGEEGTYIEIFKLDAPAGWRNC